MNKQLWLCALVVIFLLSSNAYAEKTCWCWIGPKGKTPGWISQGEPVKVVDFGGIKTFKNLESNKVQKCSQACAEWAKNSGLLGNNQALCNKIGRPVSSDEAAKLYVFSMVGAGDVANNVWDADGAPLGFKGCTRKCACPNGWYDANRQSCVIGACDHVAGISNGDKGGGYFAWNGTLYKDVPGANNCSLNPTESMTASAGSVPNSQSGDGRARAHHIRRLEIGGQFTSLNTRLNTQTQPGFGGRVTYNVLPSLAVEAAANFFPRESFTSELDGGRVTQAFVGLKGGKRFGSVGVFGTVKPGVQSYGRAITSYLVRGEFGFEPNLGRKNVFALNWGGGVELCPESRVGVRFDAGDTVTFHPSRTSIVRLRPTRVPRLREHNFQLSSGLNYRF